MALPIQSLAPADGIEFLQEHDVYQEKLPLGFTFSFPLQQLGLTKGILSRWTKGFNCEGVVGEDVVRLLKEAIARRGVSTNSVQLDDRGGYGRGMFDALGLSKLYYELFQIPIKIHGLWTTNRTFR